jgi:hypothetical protein
MKNLVLCAVFGALLLAGVGCDLFGGDDTDYYPTTVGSSWRYEGEMTIETDGDTLLTQVTNLDVTGTAELAVGGTAALFVTVDSVLQRIPWDTLLVTADTSWILKTSSFVLDFEGPSDNQPDTMLALPLEQGKTWQVFASADTTVWATVVGREDITVAAGSFKDCWEVEFEYTAGAGSFQLSYWYADGVGWVRGWSSVAAGGYTGITERRLTGYDVK